MAEPPHAMTNSELAALEAFVRQTIREAGALTLEHFRRPIAVENKAAGRGYDPVTEADRGAESAIRSRIRSRYPGHGILGEEHGHAPGSEALTWVIDPVDGTRAFITGQLHWGVLMALSDGVQPRLGAMYQPYSDELFLGSSHGAWLEHAGSRYRLRTRRCARLADAVLCCTTPEMFADTGQLEAFQRLAARVRLTRYGGDCYNYCMLAHGLVDLVVEASLSAYDIQALIPIVEAAGGGVTSWDGGSAASGGAVIAYGDPALAPAARELLGGAAGAARS